MAAPGAGAAKYATIGLFEVGTAPTQLAVDSAGGELYVVSLLGPNGFDPGRVAKFECSEVAASGTCTAGSPATIIPAESLFFFSAALNPSGHLNAFYAESETFTPKIGGFDPATGSVDAGYPFTASVGLNFGHLTEAIAVDSSGDIYVPDEAANTIKVFDPEAAVPGTAVETIDCEALSCPGGAFKEPVAVAIDSADNLYVADSGNERVVKVPAVGSPSVPVSGVAETGVAVNSANGHIFISGDDGAGAHVTEYTGAGAEVADIGTGEFKAASVSVAVDSATGYVYIGDNFFEAFIQHTPVYVFGPVQPTAETTAASALAQATATLNGQVNPSSGGAITSCEFEWGTTTEYTGGTVPCAENPGEGGSKVPVKADVSGLTPNTTYHYQLVVSNGGEAVKGGDISFKTLPPKPLATTEAATGATETAATLHATVDAEGDNAACLFEYGPTVAYGKSVACSINPVTGTAPTAVTAALSGLSAGTTYHFRVVANNKGGTSTGGDMTFATAAAPPPPAGGGSTPPATTPPATTPPPAKKPLKCKKGFKKKTVKGKAKCVKVKKKHKKH